MFDEEENKKKTGGDVRSEVQDSYDQTAKSVESAGKAVAEGLGAAGEKQARDIEDANTARQEGYNEAQRYYQQRMNEGYTQFADIISGERARADQAEKEAEDQRKREMQVARLTGLAEVAASVANLIGVGAGHASNQKYHQYSQDWMKKAEENWRHNRSRIDNLRDRQRALEERLLQLRMSDAGQALSLAQRQADAAHQDALSLAAARYGASTNPLQVGLQTAEKAGTLRNQGVVQGVNAGLHKEQADASIAQGWARIRQAEAELDAKMQQAGMTSDPSRPGKYKIDTDSEVYKSAVASGRVKSGSGSSSGNWYNVTIGGQNYALNMNKETREQAMRDGRNELKQDILEMTGVDSWKELLKGIGRRGKHNEYAQIAAALDNEGPGNREEVAEAIESFYEKHRKECSNLGYHLFRVASGAREYGAGSVETDPSDFVVRFRGGSR